jgi:Tol biopolymer transport system component
MSGPSRRGIVSSFVMVLPVAAGVVAAPGLTRDANQIPSEELRRYPPIAIAWGERGHVRYTGAGALYVVRPDETEPRLVRSSWPARRGWTVNGVYEVEWSPGRRQIGVVVALWDGDPLPQVAVVSRDGRHVRRLASPSFDDGGLEWSPNGRALVYHDYNGGELRIVDPKTGRTVRIWKSPDDPLTNPRWSPDGRRIVAERRRGIVTLAADGTDVRRLTSSRGDAAPTWSPDGRRIAFVRTKPAKDVWLIGADGKGLRRLTRSAGAGSPIWSPDGSSILFTEKRGGEGDVTYVGLVRLDGGAPERLTSDGLSSAIAWSPDGRKILSLRRTSRDWDSSWTELWVLDADGGRPTRLPFNESAWSVADADWR